MKAMRIHRFGGPEVLRLDDVPDPQPGPGEVRVRVAAASVNPVDYKMRNGDYPALRESQLPTVLGRHLCGVIDMIGPNVSHVATGEQIFAHIGFDRGAYAEYAIVRTGEFAAKPETLTVLDAGSLPLAAMTAWQGLFDHGELKAGESVLIHGASGGVGYLAVQFAKAHGANVVATASEANLAWVTSLGADQVIDYKNEDFVEKVDEVDLVLDLVGGRTRARSWAVLQPRGRLITSLPVGDVAAEGAAHARKGAAYQAHPDAAQLASVAAMADEGRLQILVDRIFPLAEAAAAHACLEHDHPRGKVVIEVR